MHVPLARGRARTGVERPAFEVAGSLAFQEAAKKAGMQLLEPIMAVEVVTPEDYLGDVIGDINAGDRVVTRGAERLNTGMKVQISEDRGGSASGTAAVQ